MRERETEIMRLRSTTFDLLVVGAGVHGAAIAREAACRGARVALVDRGDFAAGASSNSLKILHGGFRYLRQLNIGRMRSSIRCRREWAQLAPALVRPLPCAIAASGIGMRSPVALGAALCANDLISGDRNRGLGTVQRIPRGRLLPRARFDAIAAHLLGHPRSGGALWWDAVALDTEALVICLIERAAAAGGCVANYVDARALLVSGNAVHGVTACDTETGEAFEIRASRTVVAGGAGPNAVTADVDARAGISRPSCWAVNIVLNVPPACDVALAAPVPVVRGLPLPAGARQLFFVPWRNRLMIGTHYVACDPLADERKQRRRAVGALMNLAQRAAPANNFQESNICFVHWGQLALSRPWQSGEAPPLLNAPRLLDYARRAAIAGLWSIEGPKFTSALEVARRTVSRVLSTPGGPGAGARNSSVVMRGNSPDDVIFEEMPSVDAMIRVDPEIAGARAARNLAARTLEDAVLRRTGLGSAGHPGARVLESCARGMAHSLGWSEKRTASEVMSLSNYYRERHCWLEAPDGQEEM